MIHRAHIPHSDPGAKGETNRFTPYPRHLIVNQAASEHTKPRVFQASTLIDQPEDEYEREADLVAEAVMRMPMSECPACEDEKVQTKVIPGRSIHQGLGLRCARGRTTPRESNGEESLRTGTYSAFTLEGTPVTTSHLRSLIGAGTPLPASIRSVYEPRFGYDFGQVRMHNDSKAAEAAESVFARAFTMNRDIVFGAGQYTPGSATGRWLLAHELAHVVQQNRDLPGLSTQKNGSRADVQRRTASVPRRPSVRLTSPPVIQRACQHFDAGWIHPRTGRPGPAGTWCETEDEARARAIACPHDCFIYSDGPASHPYREIPGFPCAHYVAHELGIRTGEWYARCQLGYSVTIGQITRGRAAFPLNEARVNDIWSDGGHSGVVIQVDAAGDRVRIRACSVVGTVYRAWQSHGNVYR